MNSLLVRLASLKIAVALLVVILVALAAGTIVESAKGTEVAGKAVYYALWFQLVLAAFVVNVVASIAVHFPWGRFRVGFVMTHAALVVIVVGAVVSFVFKTEGQLAVWEGDKTDAFVERVGSGLDAKTLTHTLPFVVKLDAFEIDYYPGTRRPAMFRSRVQVEDAESGTNFPAVIQMNDELAYRGYRLFQSSYRMGAGRDMTVLSVSKDPGQWIVFFGYGLLLVGMCTVLGTRIAQARAMSRSGPASGLNVIRRVAAVMIALPLAAMAAPQAAAATWSDPATVEAIKRTPVQHDGRSMPVDTLAREAVWNVTRERSWRGEEPTRTVLGWTFDSQRVADEPMIKVGGKALVVAVGLPPGQTHASYSQLVRNRPLLDLFAQAHDLAEKDEPRRGVVADAEKLEERLYWVKGFFEGTVWTVVPNDADPGAAWTTPAHFHGVDDILALTGGSRPSAWPGTTAIDREILYNRIRPTRIAWTVLAAGLVASILGWSLRRRWLDVVATFCLVAGFAVMTWGIATRWAIAGRIPAANMYESLLFLAWGVGLFALVAFAVLRNRLVVLNATAMAALTMALTDLLPIDAFVHPVPPVLAGTPWLAIHVPIIMVSYAVLALGVVIAHMQIGFTIFAPKKRDVIAKMSELHYWYIHVGSILLIAGILTGSIWAASSWGRYWGWDPKEVWSLVAFLAYLGILHARIDRQIGSFAVAAISIVAFQTILMTYLGVNFVLAAGLHSYGFGGSSVVRWMALVAALEAAFLIAGWMAYRSSRDLGPVLKPA